MKPHADKSQIGTAEKVVEEERKDAVRREPPGIPQTGAVSKGAIPPPPPPPSGASKAGAANKSIPPPPPPPGVPKIGTANKSVPPPPPPPGVSKTGAANKSVPPPPPPPGVSKAGTTNKSTPLPPPPPRVPKAGASSKLKTNGKDLSSSSKETTPYPYAESLDINSGKYVTKELIKGWDPKGEDVNWGSMSEQELTELQEKIIQKGIDPMLSLFGIESSATEGDVLLLTGEELGYLMLGETMLEWDASKLFSGKKPNIKEIREALLSTEYINSESDLKGYLSDYKNMRGKAIGSYRLLNKDAAGIDKLGLHLLVHEMMHTYAHQGWKESREKAEDFSGEGGSDPIDESLTEIFARVASQEMIKNERIENLKISPSVPEDKGDIKATIDNFDNPGSPAYELPIGGVYGNNIKALIESKKSISPKDLKDWAKEYFLGVFPDKNQ